jgi:hypothetical protein
MMVSNKLSPERETDMLLHKALNMVCCSTKFNFE